MPKCPPPASNLGRTLLQRITALNGARRGRGSGSRDSYVVLQVRKRQGSSWFLFFVLRKLPIASVRYSLERGSYAVTRAQMKLGCDFGSEQRRKP